MNLEYSIRTPEALQFEDMSATLFGPNQEWYSETWKRQAGCGPTSCSAVLWYLAKTREHCSGLIDSDWQGRVGIIKLMDNTWDYVTPGGMGVNSTDILADGAVRYGTKSGVSLKCDVLKIRRLKNRSGMSQIKDFLIKSFKADVPVAFLNLSNGREDRLESWHWVVLTGINSENGLAEMYDQSKRVEIDLALWLETSLLGGGFVSINADNADQ